MFRASPRRARRLAATSCALALALPAAPADALTVVTDQDNAVCRVDHEDSEHAEFWETLQADAVAQRLAQLDEADPGLGAEIAAYLEAHQGDAESDVAEAAQGGAPEAAILQQRLGAAGAKEGLAMFLPQSRDEASAGVASKSTYTEEEARAAAKKISDDPSELASQALDAQVGTYPGVALYTLERDLFAQRREEYNELQLRLRDDLNSCADELSPGFPYGLALQITSIIVVAGMLVIAVRALRNSWSTNHHSA